MSTARGAVAGAILTGLALFIREVAVTLAGGEFVRNLPLVGPLLAGEWGNAAVLGTIIGLALVVLAWTGRLQEPTDSAGSTGSPSNAVLAKALALAHEQAAEQAAEIERQAAEIQRQAKQISDAKAGVEAFRQRALDVLAKGKRGLPSRWMPNGDLSSFAMTPTDYDECLVRAKQKADDVLAPDCVLELSRILLLPSIFVTFLAWSRIANKFAWIYVREEKELVSAVYRHLPFKRTTAEGETEYVYREAKPPRWSPGQDWAELIRQAWHRVRPFTGTARFDSNAQEWYGDWPGTVCFTEEGNHAARCFTFNDGKLFEIDKDEPTFDQAHAARSGLPASWFEQPPVIKKKGKKT